jgi:hypothetical protein
MLIYICTLIYISTAIYIYIHSGERNKYMYIEETVSIYVKYISLNMYYLISHLSISFSGPLYIDSGRSSYIVARLRA